MIKNIKIANLLEFHRLASPPHIRTSPDDQKLKSVWEQEFQKYI